MVCVTFIIFTQQKKMIFHQIAICHAAFESNRRKEKKPSPNQYFFFKTQKRGYGFKTNLLNVCYI